MRRLVALPALLAALVSCNAILGIHEVDIDASTDPCNTVCACHADSDCADPHSACVDIVTARTCECSAGYATGGSDGTTAGCGWVGVLADPGFSQGSSAWQLGSGVTIDAAGSGNLDPGYAVLVPAPKSFDPSACRGRGQLEQTVVMPRRSRSEALVLSTTSGESDVHSEGELALGVGPIWSSVRPGEGFGGGIEWATTRSCLGVAQYAPEGSPGIGAPLTVLAIGSTNGFECGLGSQPQDPLLAIDRIEILPAMPGECPEPNTTTNGNAEGSDGWSFSESDQGSDGSFAGYGSGLGENGSRGIELVTKERCDFASATTTTSVPLLASPALTVYRSSSTDDFALVLESQYFAGNGTGVQHFCLPPALAGGVYAIEAELNIDAGTGPCNDPIEHELVVDDLAIADDAHCTAGAGIADPDFESGYPTGGAVGESGGTAGSTLDTNAHGGQRDMQLTTSTVCSLAFYQAIVAAPPSVLGAGPAVTFFYRAAAGTSLIVGGVSGGGTFSPAIRDGQWHQGTICLDPTVSSQPQRPYVQEQDSSSGTCGSASPLQTVALDDFAVTTSAQCPAN